MYSFSRVYEVLFAQETDRLHWFPETRRKLDFVRLTVSSIDTRHWLISSWSYQYMSQCIYGAAMAPLPAAMACWYLDLASPAAKIPARGLYCSCLCLNIAFIIRVLIFHQENRCWLLLMATKRPSTGRIISLFHYYGHPNQSFPSRLRCNFDRRVI